MARILVVEPVAQPGLDVSHGLTGETGDALAGDAIGLGIVRHGGGDDTCTGG